MSERGIVIIISKRGIVIIMTIDIIHTDFHYGRELLNLAGRFSFQRHFVEFFLHMRHFRQFFSPLVVKTRRIPLWREGLNKYLSNGQVIIYKWEYVIFIFEFLIDTLTHIHTDTHAHAYRHTDTLKHTEIDRLYQFLTGKYKFGKV